MIIIYFLNDLTFLTEIIMITTNEGLIFLKSFVQHIELFFHFLRDLYTYFPFFFEFDILPKELIVSIQEMILFVLILLRKPLTLRGCKGRFHNRLQSHKGNQVTIILISTIATIQNSNIFLHHSFPLSNFAKKNSFQQDV